MNVHNGLNQWKMELMIFKFISHTKDCEFTISRGNFTSGAPAGF